MKLKEVFLDIIIGTKLFEMAYSRAKAEYLVTAQSPQIFKHFIKLFVFNLPDTRNHWIVELNSYFKIINDITLKPNNKIPDKHTVYKWLVYDSAPHYTAQWVSRFVKVSLLDEYKGVQIYDYDAEIVLNKILSIIDKILIDIEQRKFISVGNYLN